MRDILTKLAILLDLLLDQYGYWRKEIWAKDLDSRVCCDGRECGCYGQTVRDIFKPAQRTGAGHE